MRRNLFQISLLIVLSIVLTSSIGLSAENPFANEQGSGSADQKYAGTWVGSYSTDGGEQNKLSYVLSKDEKGLWHGTVRFTNNEGEQTAAFKSLQIADGKMKGKIDSPDGEVEVAIEGQFRGDRCEGTYAVSPKGSADIVERGTWTVTKSAATKAGQ